MLSTRPVMPSKKTATPGKGRRRRKLAGHSIGLTPTGSTAGSPSDRVIELQQAIERDGGKLLTAYREPFGGHWLLMATLPIEQVEPTPYQRNLSDAHVRRLETVIAKLGRFIFRAKDAEPLGFDEIMERMRKAAAKLNVEKIKMDDLAKSGGAPEEE